MNDDEEEDFSPYGTRKTIIEQMRESAKAVFAEKPELNSIVLAVAQYWADEADDAVHCNVYASARSIPLWPHRCAEASYNDDLENIPGEVCGECGGGIDCYPEDWDDNGGAIQAFEAYCHEAGSQEESSFQNDLPAVLFRRDGDDVAVEMIGDIQRPGSFEYEWGEEVDHATPDPTWDDPRARELLAQIAAAPDDDGPRRVLADYLMENENPRGEYIALALDGRDRARERALLAEHETTWLNPIERMLLRPTVRWSRGFPVAADIHVIDDTVIPDAKGAVAWCTFERLAIHGRDVVLDPAMRALRELETVDGDWIDVLVSEKQPWAIERLVVHANHPVTFEKLAKATNLPALRELVVSTVDPDKIVAMLPHARWWSQLQRLSVWSPSVSLADWQKRRHELAVPWFGVARWHHDPASAAGWEFAFDQRGACEVTLRGFTPEATLEALSELLPSVQAQTIRLVPSRHYAPAAVDVERLGDARVSL